MAITEEVKGIPVHRIALLFCDKTVSEQTYEVTSWGGLSADADFYKWCERANENFTVLARQPHLIRVELHRDGQENSLCEDFLCPCRQKEMRSA